MRYLKLYEAFKSEKLSKIWKYYKQDENFARAFKGYCTGHDIRISELTNDNFDLLSTEETLELLKTEVDDCGIIAHLFWFNDEKGLIMSCNQSLRDVRIFNNVNGNDISSYESYSIKENKIKNTMDYCIVFYLLDTEPLDHLRRERSVRKPDVFSNDELKQINIENYIHKLSDKITFNKDDLSMISNFGYVVKRFFTYLSPLSYFRNPDRIISLNRIISIYIRLFRDEYEYAQDSIDNIRKFMTNIYEHEINRFVTTQDLESESARKLSKDKRELILLMIEINELLKNNLNSFKFVTVSDIFIFDKVLNMLRIDDNSLIDSYLTHWGDDIEGLCNYLSNQNNIYVQRQISNLNLYKEIVKYTFKN